MLKRKKPLEMTTVLGRGSIVNGNFEAKGSARIDGIIEGDVSIEGALIVGPQGQINGDVNCQELISGGEIFGNIMSSEKVELTATGKVIGDIVTKVIVIDEKAIFQGKCDMNASTLEKRKPATVKTEKIGNKTVKAAIQEALREVAEAEKLEESKEVETYEHSTKEEIKENTEKLNNIEKI